MPAKDCPVCGKKMLRYENPERWVCLRVNKHHLYLSGGTVGRGGRQPKKR